MINNDCSVLHSSPLPSLLQLCQLASDLLFLRRRNTRAHCRFFPHHFQIAQHQSAGIIVLHQRGGTVRINVEPKRRRDLIRSGRYREFDLDQLCRCRSRIVVDLFLRRARHRRHGQFQFALVCGLGQDGGILPHHSLAIPGEIGRRFTETGSGIEIGRDATSRLGPAQRMAVLALAHRGVRRR